MIFVVEHIGFEGLTNVLINHQFIMKLFKSISLGIVIALISISACKKNETSETENSVTSTPQMFTDYLGEKTTEDISGTVLDSQNNPIPNASVVIGTKTTNTDSLGNFTLTDAPVNTKFASINAKKEDYKSTTISKVPGDTAHVTLILHQESEPCLYWFCKSNHTLSD